MFKRMIRCVLTALAAVLLCAVGVYAQLPPVAEAVLGERLIEARFRESLPPVAEYILYEMEDVTQEGFTDDNEEAPVLKESNWDDLPEAELPTDDITPFFLAFRETEGAPEIMSPRDGAMLPDNSNIHIRVKYDGSEECYAEINSTVSSSFIKIENNELVILSSKLVRNREYHLRVRAGYKFSETVSFRVGSKYEDEIARIIANTDIVAVRPRISMEKMFPNGFFHSEEEADAAMATITVKVWRADTEDVEVDEEEVVDEIVRTVSVPVKKYLRENAEAANEETLLNKSVNGERLDEAEETAEGETEAEETEDTAADEAAAEPAEDEVPEEISPADGGDDADEEQLPPSDDEEEPTEKNDETEDEAADERSGEETTEQVEIVEEYTEITTVEYVTKTVRRKVKHGELYSSTMSITVNRALADSYIAIFNELYALKFPIESAGCYNWRNTASGRISEHALGTAIDINPDQNYCVYGDGSTVGSYWRPYEDIYSVTPEVVNVFRKYNFSWGGSWVSPQDYMHFSYFGT